MSRAPRRLQDSLTNAQLGLPKAMLQGKQLRNQMTKHTHTAPAAGAEVPLLCSVAGAHEQRWEATSRLRVAWAAAWLASNTAFPDLLHIRCTAHRPEQEAAEVYSQRCYTLLPVVSKPWCCAVLLVCLVTGEASGFVAMQGCHAVLLTWNCPAGFLQAGLENVTSGDWQEKAAPCS
eukprot:GHRQ01015380.1.p1 GENE.GHRQ01015380.1~~GHRQ01015380.1.p1  ORF type:complete len:176 (-),score=24.14 GHRQ01015380.1:713-1240(-)